MKKILFAFLASLLLVSFTFPQATTTNTTTKTYVYTPGTTGLLTAIVFDVTFSNDSTGAQATPVLTVPEYNGVDPAVYPVHFRLKAVGTHGTPASDIFLQGLYRSTTDTVSIDTIRATATAQGEVDSLGILNLNGGFKPPYGYKAFIRVITADVNTGYLQLVFPIPPEANIRKDPRSTVTQTLK